MPQILYGLSRTTKLKFHKGYVNSDNLVRFPVECTVFLFIWNKKLEETVVCSIYAIFCYTSTETHSVTDNDRHAGLLPIKWLMWVIPVSYTHLDVYKRQVEACHARSITSNDNEWRECLNEAKELHSPKQMRNLFGYICALNLPANGLALWNEFKVYLSEDFLRDYNEEVSFNTALLNISMENHTWLPYSKIYI